MRVCAVILTPPFEELKVLIGSHATLRRRRLARSRAIRTSKSISERLDMPRLMPCAISSSNPSESNLQALIQGCSPLR